MERAKSKSSQPQSATVQSETSQCDTHQDASFPPVQRNMLQMQRLIGNSRLCRMIQRSPDEKPSDQTSVPVKVAPAPTNQLTADTKADAALPAADAPAEVSGTPELNATLKQKLVAGTFAYQGYYNDPSGKFEDFKLPELETARKHYMQWADSVASGPKLSPWEQTMQRAFAAQAKKLAEQKKRAAENRARVRDNKETNSAAMLRTGIANAEKRPNKQVVGLPNDPVAYRRMLAEGMEADPKKRDPEKLKMYKDIQPLMDVNAAIYQTLRSQQRDMASKRVAKEKRYETELPTLFAKAQDDYLKAKKDFTSLAAAFNSKPHPGVKTTPDLIRLESAMKVAKVKAEALEAEEKSYPTDKQELLMAEFQIRLRIISIAEQLDAPYKSLGIEGRYANQDPRKIADPKEREKKIQEDPFLSKGIDVPGRFVESKEIEDDKKWVKDELAKETDQYEEGTFETGTAVDLPNGADPADTPAAAAAPVAGADNQTAHPQGDTGAPQIANPQAEADAPAPEAPKTLHEMSANMQKQDVTALYKTLKAETELASNHQQMVIAGDTAGHNIVDHPQWFIKIMTKLMGLTPADPIKKVENAGPVWDSEADGAQAVLTAYLNAWTKRRMAIMHKTDGKDKEGRNEKIPTNIEVMNAAVGFSETNERAELYSGLRGEMDWCGPGTQRSIILGLWKAGLYLRTGKPPLALQHLQEIPDIAKKIRALDAEIEQLSKEGDPKKKDVLRAKKMERRNKFWQVWGQWIRTDLTTQDSSMIGDWFKEGVHKAPEPAASGTKPANGGTAGKPADGGTTGANTAAPAEVDQRRQIDLPEAATAPLYPGDFVYWVSSYPYGPVAGHVATIIEEKDREKKPDPGSTDAHVSTLHIDSANAGGVRQGEGSVRPEQIERVVTNASFDYWKAAGWSNAYYYGLNPAVSRDEYDKRYKAAQKTIQQQGFIYTTDGKQVEDSSCQDPTQNVCNPTSDVQNKNTTDKPEEAPNVKPLGEAIKKHKASSPFPVHKLPQTPADYLEPSNRYTAEPGTIGPRKPDSVWVVSIKRTSKMLDPLKMLEADGDKADKGYSALKDGSQALDLKKLGERRVAVMPPGMKEAIIEILDVGGFGRLMRGETFDSKLPSGTDDDKATTYRAYDHLDGEDKGTINAEKRKVAGPDLYE